MKTYYLTQRPFSIGTQPSGFINCPEATSITAYGNRRVWPVVYPFDLTMQEITGFELCPSATVKAGARYPIKLGRHNGELEILSVSADGTELTVNEIWPGQDIEPETYTPMGLYREYKIQTW